MAFLYQTLSLNNKTLVLTQHMESGMMTRHSNPPFKTVFFNPYSKKAISLLCTILGYKNDEEVDETLFVFLS